MSKSDIIQIDEPEITFTVTLGDGSVAHCEELASQPYANCKFSAGAVHGIDLDTLYLRMERDGDEASPTWFLRPDELAALLWVGMGAMWSAVLELVERGGA